RFDSRAADWPYPLWRRRGAVTGTHSSGVLPVEHAGGVRTDMLTKTQPDEIQDYLADASYVKGGHASRVVFPESAEDVAEVLAKATSDRTPVTVSGAGTGTVGGRVPFGGVVLATNKLNRIIIENEKCEAEAGVRLSDLQSTVNAQSLFYPPDPTERSCFLGGTIATNASGARTFKYGATRNYVQALKVVLASGDIIDLQRGELFAGKDGKVFIPLSSGGSIEAQLPTYSMPRVRKHASGYFVAPEMDVIDLFIGSEGTLGVITEAELRLLPKPAGLLSGVVFFDDEDNLLAFVRAARERSLASRGSSPTVREGSVIDARALEYFDVESLNFLRQRYDSVPERCTGAIFFEQETTPETEDSLMNEWLVLVETHQALADESWFAANEADQAKLREFRHALPVLMNEWFARYQQRKVSTDMAVPDEAFAGMLHFYQDILRGGDLRYTIFGHIGDNHVHVNILPRNDTEAAKAWGIYYRFIRRAVDVGGTISAEHGIGKLKRDYLVELYGEQHLREMAKLKLAFDPAGILGRGNIIPENYYRTSMA
ncbi:MAG TPA: FAD-binding oxidoreductase, partial [Pyrinomonadaceae bacterium]|nr:FAD-binding oxidoreductase [Pyrinomonadaceae bacterium]